MAVDHAELLKRGLHLQNIGNRLISLFGGRSVHPVGVRPGGFHRCPDPQRLQALLSDCRAALSEAAALVRWIADLDMPDDTQEFVSVCLRHDDEFPMAQGRIISSEGHDLPASGFDQHFREFQVPHSTALHSHLDGRPYLVGPLARMNLCMEQLTPATQSLLDNIRHPFPSRNMFHSMLARAIEIHEALVEAIRLLQWPQNNSPFEPVKPVAGVGFGATEAPRGLLWHRFAFDHEGLVTEARIVPPTSQNQARIEADLRAALARHGLDRTDDSIRMHAEKVIRNYDPCISCATHFLTLNIKRAG
jgi:coenzyme F420-reducing hydrogenase alpha subunit